VLSSFSCSAPTHCWGKDTLMAVYTINRLPTLVFANCNPCERLFGTFLTYHHLPIFGSNCFVLPPLHERTKLDPCSCLCCSLSLSLPHYRYLSWAFFVRTTIIWCSPSRSARVPIFYSIWGFRSYFTTWPSLYREASTNPFWQATMKEKLEALHKIVHGI